MDVSQLIMTASAISYYAFLVFALTGVCAPYAKLTLVVFALTKACAPYAKLTLVVFDLTGVCAPYAKLTLVFGSQLYKPNFWVLGMIFYFGFACMITMMRGTVRRTYSLMGDLFRDLLASFVWYPFALIQVRV